MQKRGYIGIGLIVLGLAVFFAEPLGITGAVIGLEDAREVWFYLIGTLMIVGGLILQARTPREDIGEIVNRLAKGQISPIRAAAEMNRIVPIYNVRYKTGKQHSLVSARDAYPVALKEGDEAEQLAMTEYIFGVGNNPHGVRGSNLEFRKGVSTKHYMKAFQAALERFRVENAEELREVGLA